MRYMLIALMLLVISGCGSGCSGTKPKAMHVNVTFANTSTNELVGVKIECLGRDLDAGILIRGGDATILDVPWPNASSGKIMFIDRLTQKPYSIDVSLVSVNERIKAGKCKGVVIRILNYDKGEVVCE
jgi:uncharacterized protein YceK